ncbi:hypothetical protein F5B21DRAFT_493619 [Xylaria acuta]|nr:hypothetical protein F5B21DRAFT_493619 [Xylaria acuta]
MLVAKERILCDAVLLLIVAPAVEYWCVTLSIPMLLCTCGTWNTCVQKYGTDLEVSIMVECVLFQHGSPQMSLKQCDCNSSQILRHSTR